MIFVSVGQMLPFDRLIRLVDEWAASRGRQDLFAQIGNARYVPECFASVDFLTPSEFRRRLCEAEVFVSHAGTGSILAALEAGKRILVLPRRTEWKEATTDHQVATARHFESRGLVRAVYDDADFMPALDRLLDDPPPPAISSKASPDLVARLRSFIFEGR